MLLHSTLWQSGTATVLALAITTGAIAPLLTPQNALAQYRRTPRWPRSPQTQTSSPSQRAYLSVPTGTVIPVRYDDAEKIVVTPDETKSLTLQVARSVTARNGTILIPAGSQIVGELRPARNGSQFVANQLIFNPGRSQEQRYYLNASSRIVTRTERVRQGANTGEILKGAAIGGAAAAAISAITGDRAIATEELLGGAGLGALGGFLLNRRQVDVVVVYPNQDLAVKLNTDLALR